MEAKRYVVEMPSPVGLLTLTASDSGLISLTFPNHKRTWAEDEQLTPRSNPVLDAAQEQLAAYFAGRLQRFDLPLAFQGTEFQVAVWRSLVAIPFGQTVCYAEIAARIGRTKAVRAVGSANGQNRMSIIVPCHRVIGSNGTLTGYAGGLPVKRRLLDFESQTSRPVESAATTQQTLWDDAKPVLIGG